MLREKNDDSVDLIVAQLFRVAPEFGPARIREIAVRLRLALDGQRHYIKKRTDATRKAKWRH